MSALTFTPREIIAEFVARTRPPRQDQLDAFARQGISMWAVAGHPGSGEHVIGFARVERLADGSFEFADNGERAMLAIALDAFGEPSDVVAWPPRCEWAAAWLGRVAILGQQHIDGPRLGNALPIFLTPLDWLRADREGVVLIDKARAARELLGRGPFLAMGGGEHGERLEALLTPPKPVILVPRPERAAA